MVEFDLLKDDEERLPNVSTRDDMWTSHFRGSVIFQLFVGFGGYVGHFRGLRG